MSLTPGARLGAYEVIGRLGAGAMGEVYRARDTRLGREVALKILPAEFAANPDRRRRFEVESRSAQITFGSYFNPSFPLSVSPDGKSLAISVYNVRFEVWMLEGFRQPGGWLSRLWP